MKLIKTADLRDVLDSYNREEISYTKMVDILNEKANERLKAIERGYKLANKRHEEVMKRYKALVDLTNEPDVEAWESKMKQRAIEFAMFARNIMLPDEMAMEIWYNKKYGSYE